ncbi:alpha/beta fold hydrolase [Kitasatospora sp. NBC_00374]
MPGAEMVTVPGADHFVNLSAPERFVELVDRAMGG